MSIEVLIEKLTEALIANTAALAGKATQPKEVEKPAGKVGIVAAASLRGCAQPKAAEKPAPKVEEKATTPAVQPKDVADAVLDLASKRGREAALGVLKAFNVTRAGELKPEQLADALTAIKTALDSVQLPGVAATEASLV